MAQFSKLLPVLVLLTLCKPIVCPLPYDKRDRAPYIDSNEYSIQQIDQVTGTTGSRLRKSSSYIENTANYRHQEQQVEAPQVVEITTFTVLEENLRNAFNVNQSHHNHGDETTIHTAVEEDIRSIFDTYIGPGTHEFNNVNRSDSDQMIGDQPDPFTSAPTHTSSDKMLLPNEKLGLLYNDFNITKKGTDSTSLTGITSDSNENINSNNKDSFENHFDIPSSGGLFVTKDKVETSTQDHIRKKVTGPAYIVDSKDCVDDDAKSGKPFCTRLRNYPEQTHLEEIIKTKFNNLESFFGEDSLMPQDINNRVDNEPPVILCDSITRMIYPKAGLNKDYEWLFIINTEEYKQGVLVEECINESSVSASIYPPKNYKVTCKQNYIYRSLVAYANGAIVKEKFKMPSCCKCVLTVS